MAFPVRMFEVQDKHFILLMDIEDDDTTKVINEDEEEIGLKFDSSTYAYYKDKRIGKLRLPFTGEPDNIHFIKYSTETDPEVTIDTGCTKEHVECYLNAEVFIAKYLIENKIINIEKENAT